MVLLRRTRDEDAERLLGGHAPAADRAPDLERVAAFLDALRAAVPTTPSRAREAELVRRLSDAALEADNRIAAAPTRPLRAVPAPRRPAWRARLALAAKVAVAVALLPAALAGLAVAGVTLPAPAREAMEGIGLELPNQPPVDEPKAADGDETDGKGNSDRAARPSRGNGGSSGGGGGGASGKPSSTDRGQPARRGQSQNPSADGEPGHDSRGQGTPQLGEPAPITPPGQGGTPPGQGGTPPGQGGPSPGQGTPRGAQPQSTGTPEGEPPGQAKK